MIIISIIIYQYLIIHSIPKIILLFFFIIKFLIQKFKSQDCYYFLIDFINLQIFIVHLITHHWSIIISNQQYVMLLTQLFITIMKLSNFIINHFCYVTPLNLLNINHNLLISYQSYLRIVLLNLINLIKIYQLFIVLLRSMIIIYFFLILFLLYYPMILIILNLLIRYQFVINIIVNYFKQFKFFNQHCLISSRKHFYFKQLSFLIQHCLLIKYHFMLK